MNIVVLTGGKSDEREISVLSSKNVINALEKLGHKVEVVDVKDRIDFSKIQGDLVFPVLHGVEGEGGKLQEELEKRETKFVGSGSKACNISWQKIAFKKFCEKQGIKTPKWQTINSISFKINIPIPYVIKPSDNGSSIDLYLIRSEEDLKKVSFEKLFNKYKEILIEEYLKGIEVTAGVLKGKALPLIEIVPPKGEMFDYENKYNGKTKEIPFAPSIPLEIQEKVKFTALKIHKELGCKDFSRTDFIIREDEVFVLELNSIPGLTSESLFPKAAKAIGLNFEQMIEKILLD